MNITVQCSQILKFTVAYATIPKQSCSVWNNSAYFATSIHIYTWYPSDIN